MWMVIIFAIDCLQNKISASVSCLIIILSWWPRWSLFIYKFSLDHRYSDLAKIMNTEMNTESFLSLRTFEKFFVFLSLVKVFLFFIFLGFVIFFFHCTLSIASCEYICVYNWEPSHNRDGPSGIQYLCSLSASVPKMGLYGVAEQKDVWRTVLYNGFRFVLGYRDWPTWTPNGVGSPWTQGVLYLPPRCLLPDDK